jgi:thiamine-phosphate pyrophosphorylase
MQTIPAFYPILDTAVAARCGHDPVHAAEILLSAGAGILQFRHKGFFSRDVFSKMEQIAALCREARVPFVVNDRADLAALLAASPPAGGSALTSGPVLDVWLHLGQDDLPPSVARRVIGPRITIGYSTHNESQLRAALAEPVNYLALGPIFGTVSKEHPDPIVGIEELRRLRPLCDRPLVAIGGITRANAREVLGAGADSVAVIGDLFADTGGLRTAAKEWLQITGRNRGV